MGKQYDKVIKRKRRLAYLERVKEKAKNAAVNATKPKVRKPKPKAATPAPEEAAPKKAPREKAVAAPESEAPPKTELADGTAEITSAGPTAITEESVSPDTDSDPTAAPVEETAAAPAE